MSVITFKFRIKDATTRKHLARHALACNQIWNFCCATQREAERRRGGDKRVRWPTAFDLDRLTKSVAAELGIHSDTVTQVCRQFAKSRDEKGKCPRFRSSFGGKRALGWVPFIPRATKIDGDAAIYLKRRYRFWKSREVEGRFRAGHFVEDARGRWYVAFQCEVADDLHAAQGMVGIDLGLKDLATLSNGEVVPALKHFRQHEVTLAVAQRARNKKRVRAIHAKIANARRHHLHEQSTRIARENSLIVVGDVNASAIAKTRLAKSVLDAGWSSFRHMLRYKAARRQAVYVEASERYSSQTCSCCGTIPASSPKGMGALGIRRWECSDCGASHDRDENAARNILRVGLERQPPGGGIAIGRDGERANPRPPYPVAAMTLG
ncbi:transposase [uncultured Hyphomicrobium sp.]|uniref:RNA-guided endonuclease InsQ/TnpB family protein n=1 Tax=uncultured Hyphomicrobium sp. TaxID=194373 RepID=UPI0025FA19ED|nr:transposase [uncultured Hyphomicrobium sp.]